MIDEKNYPPRNEWPEIRLMVKLATMHYIDGLPQRDLADITGISASTVSRLLKKAEQMGVVRFRIHNPLPFEMEEERFLERTFHLREAIVVDPPSQDEDAIIQTLGSVAGDLILQHINETTILGIGQGSTMRAMVNRVMVVSNGNYKDLQVVPLVGGLARDNPEFHTNFLARELALTLGGRHLELYAPVLADNPQNRNAFMSDSSVSFVLERAKNANVMVLGIGDVSPVSRLISLCSFTLDDMTRLTADGAIGEINSVFYNGNGQPCSPYFNDRVVGLTLEDIRKAPLVIGVAGGERKIKAIYGALKGGLLDVLITDRDSAYAIREIETSEKK